MGTSGNQCEAVETSGNQWEPVGTNGNQWEPVGACFPSTRLHLKDTVVMRSSLNILIAKASHSILICFYAPPPLKSHEWSCVTHTSCTAFCKCCSLPPFKQASPDVFKTVVVNPFSKENQHGWWCTNQPSPDSQQSIHQWEKAKNLKRFLKENKIMTEFQIRLQNTPQNQNRPHKKPQT